MKRSRALLRHAEAREINDFRAMLAHYMEGNISAGEFEPYLSRLGIHACGGQDEYQLRIQVPGGRLSMSQFRSLGGLAAESVAKAPLSLAAYQEIQLQFLRLWELPALIQRLEDLGLSCRRLASPPVNAKSRSNPEAASQGQAPGEGEDGYETWYQAHVRFQRHLGSYCAVIPAPRGNLGPRQVEAIALFMEGAGLPEIRMDDEGKLLLPRIPARLLPVLYSGLKRLDLVGNGSFAAA